MDSQRYQFKACWGARGDGGIPGLVGVWVLCCPTVGPVVKSQKTQNKYLYEINKCSIGVSWYTAGVMSVCTDEKEVGYLTDRVANFFNENSQKTL